MYSRRKYPFANELKRLVPYSGSTEEDGWPRFNARERDTVKDQGVSFLWQDTSQARRLRTGVCPHGHTLHSEECLSFLPRYLRFVPGVSQIVSRYQRGAQPAVDYSRAFWTPPLTPASAFRVERKQVADLDSCPLIPLTDHDNIEAGIALREEQRDVPISFEWTVPFRRSIFHLGIHNLPPASAKFWNSAMANYGAAPQESLLRDILSGLASIPDVLIVLNHPFWLEEGVEETDHRPALDQLLCECLSWLHAFELSGTRQWAENSATIELAEAYSRPSISGGETHACEPGACLNLTNAESFPSS